MGLTLVLYTCLVLGLLWAEVKQVEAAQWIFKPAAAAGFIAIALIWGTFDDQYGRLVLFGLIACAAGDVCLLSRKSRNLFLAGMTAFAIGHIAYFSAFIGSEPYTLTARRLIPTTAVLFGGAGVFVWLRPHLPHDMRLPVKTYVFIILLMVIAVLGLPTRGPLRLALAGAVMFAVSDIFVARDRFVKPTPRNALAITPLYFGAQALIALSMEAGI